MKTAYRISCFGLVLAILVYPSITLSQNNFICGTGGTQQMTQFHGRYLPEQGTIRARPPLFEQRSLPSFTTVDSSRLEFFPLQVGNVWQWKSRLFPSKIRQWEITSDTIISGKKYYKTIRTGPRTTYLVRIDSQYRVQNYIGIPCGDSVDEYCYYRLGESVNFVYEVCTDVTGGLFGKPALMKFTGIAQARIFGEVRDIMEFIYGGIRGSDTSYAFHFYLVKGIGIYFEEYEVEDYQCTGAIINGKVYGTILKTEKPTQIYSQPRLDNNYPNPCRNYTQISFYIHDYAHVDLKIYNINAVEIKTILSEEKAAGQYSLFMNTESMNGGIYYYILTISSQKSNYRLHNKFIIVK